LELMLGGAAHRRKDGVQKWQRDRFMEQIRQRVDEDPTRGAPGQRVSQPIRVADERDRAAHKVPTRDPEGRRALDVAMRAGG
jgi:hypothetical protein